MKQPNNWEIFRAARDCPDALSHYEKVVLLIYASYAGPGGKDIYPSDVKVARGLNCSVDSVRRARRGLKQKGYIQVVSEAPGFVTHYKLVMEKLGLIDQADEPIPASTSKLRKPPRLEAIPSEEETPELPTLTVSAQLRMLRKRMETYHRFSLARHPDAELHRPGRQEMKEIVLTYRRLLEGAHPEASQWELAAEYARQELELQGVLL